MNLWQKPKKYNLREYLGIFPKMKSFLKNLTLLVLTLQSLQFHVKFQKNPIIFEKKALLTTPVVVLVVVLVVLVVLVVVLSSSTSSSTKQ